MIEMNYETARFNMLEQQIRPWEILDQDSLDIMQQIPREEFVAEPYTAMAFIDTELPLQHGQSMLAPKIEAKILQAVQIKSTENILEIGTGSGYLTALLATAGNSVRTMDIYQDFLDLARERLISLDITNVSFDNMDLYAYNNSYSKYDVIVAGGSVSKVPDILKQALNIDGRLFIVVGQSPLMNAKLITRVTEDSWMEENLFETELAPFVNPDQKRDFIF